MSKPWRETSAKSTAGAPLRRNIVFLGTAHDNGGSSILAGNLARAMRAEGHRVEEWYLFGSQFGASPDARVFNEGIRVRSPLKLFMLFARVILALRRHKPDTIFGLQSLSNLIAGLGGWLAGIPNRIATHHNPAGLLDPTLMRLDALIGRLGFYTRIIACAATVGESFERNGEAYSRRMRIIANGQRRPKLIARDDARRQLGLSLSEKIIGQIGRMCEQKNQEFSLDLLKDIPDATMLFVGTGPDEAAIRAAAAESGIKHRVYFIPAIEYEHIGVFYSAVDAAIFPSRFEGLSLAAIEAIHAGVPIVCSDIPSFREMFHDAPELARDLLVPLSRRDQWAARLRAVLADQALRARIRKEFTKLSPSFDFDIMAKRYLAVLD